MPHIIIVIADLASLRRRCRGDCVARLAHGPSTRSNQCHRSVLQYAYHAIQIAIYFEREKECVCVWFKHPFGSSFVICSALPSSSVRLFLSSSVRLFLRHPFGSSFPHLLSHHAVHAVLRAPGNVAKSIWPPKLRELNIKCDLNFGCSLETGYIREAKQGKCVAGETLSSSLQHVSWPVLFFTLLLSLRKQAGLGPQNTRRVHTHRSMAFSGLCSTPYNSL